MNYKNLFVMTAISFVAMYILMYLMVDQFANVYTNLNQLYMAGVMTLPMIIIELWLMGEMYPNKRINAALLISCSALFFILILFVRKQTAITDKEFLKSMIPHHAGALLMCKRAKLQDPEIKELCTKIIEGQQTEIEFMKAKLAQD